jgi:predicted HNH restriction endonuclease
LASSISLEDSIFTEGKRIRVSHLKTERNRNVVKYYFDNTPRPALCDVCEKEVKWHYPWLENLIEVHHILPLSSPLNINTRGTSIADLVGLCPNCHRATHAFYRNYLKINNLEDFRCEEEAKDVYSMVRSTFVKF